MVLGDKFKFLNISKYMFCVIFDADYEYAIYISLSSTIQAQEVKNCVGSKIYSSFMLSIGSTVWLRKESLTFRNQHKKETKTYILNFLGTYVFRSAPFLPETVLTVLCLNRSTHRNLNSIFVIYVKGFTKCVFWIL